MDINLELLNSVNQCQIDEMEKVGKTLSSKSTYGYCAIFSEKVQNVQAAIIHTYQVVGYAAVRQADPKKASELWRQMSAFCDQALGVLRGLKDVYPECGTPGLYDLALDYKNAADKRYFQNAQDAECQTTPPDQLFPKTS